MILPGTGRGTMRSMVEGQVPHLHPAEETNSRGCPSTSFAGPPPPVGED